MNVDVCAFNDAQTPDHRLGTRAAGVVFSARLRSIEHSFLDRRQKFLEPQKIPTKRKTGTVEQALAHPYLAAFHNPAAEPVSATAFDFDASEAAASADAQQALFREVCRFRPELAAITSPPSKAKRRHPSEYGSSSPSSRNWPRYQPAAAANRGAAHRGAARG